MTWIRKRKRYSKPRKLHDKARMEEENQLIKRYGLKNKREIWKADAAIERIRSRGKSLITASKEEQKELFDRLDKMGFKVEKIADILALNKEDWLKRRLQSILVRKRLAKPREARQLIVHKHVAIDDTIVNIPSYMVKVDEEGKIKVFKRIKKQQKEKREEEKEEIE